MRFTLKPSDNLHSPTFKSYRAFAIGVALFVVLSSFTSRRGDARDWSRWLTDANAFAHTPGIPFVVSYVEHKADVLSVPLGAFCWFRYTVGTDPVTLHGEKRPDGTFEPIVKYEVATEDKTKWKQIRADIEQHTSETIVVNPDNPVVKLWVDMEPFRKTIGVFRYGRLVLENGDAAIFEIEDLLPTADARDETDDYKEVVFQPDDEKKKEGFADAWLAEPANLFSVISFGNLLIGDFTFEAQPKAVSLQGTRTLDGDFWPKATFQVANSDHVWKTIGKSQHSGTPVTLEIAGGKAERIRILLTDYKPLIGKFKYGKVVFSNGQSGVFSIDLLNPK